MNNRFKFRFLEIGSQSFDYFVAMKRDDLLYSFQLRRPPLETLRLSGGVGGSQLPHRRLRSHSHSLQKQRICVCEIDVNAIYPQGGSRMAQVFNMLSFYSNSCRLVIYSSTFYLLLFIGLCMFIYVTACNISHTRDPLA